MVHLAPRPCMACHRRSDVAQSRCLCRGESDDLPLMGKVGWKVVGSVSFGGNRVCSRAFYIIPGPENFPQKKSACTFQVFPALQGANPIKLPRYRSSWSLAHVDSLATLRRSTAALYGAWCQGVQAKRMGRFRVLIQFLFIASL